MSDLAIRRKTERQHEPVYIGKGWMVSKSTLWDALIAHAKGTAPFQCKRVFLLARQDKQRETLSVSRQRLGFLFAFSFLVFAELTALLLKSMGGKGGFVGSSVFRFSFGELSLKHSSVDKEQTDVLIDRCSIDG